MMRRVRAGLFAALLGCAAGTQARQPASQEQPYVNRPEARAFIAAMVEKHGFVERELKRLFAGAYRQPAILKAIRPPESPRSRSWRAYRAIFVDDAHLTAGRRFMQRHAAALARAERDYGVPAEIVTAIIGVETFYGRNTGKWRVIDALATLAFDYPPRADFFRAELEAYLLFVRDAGLDVFGVKGSYAGAIGIPQFMPGSYRRWAVDFDGDGAISLRANPVDAIGSVANFLKAHGWLAGEPILFRTQVGTADVSAFAAAGLKPQWSLAQLAAAGVSVHAVTLPQPDTPVSLIELETPDEKSEYRAGLENFFVLTRYNRSSFYASAVNDLAEELRALR